MNGLVVFPTFFSLSLKFAKRRRSIQSAKTRPGADCGLDHEFLIAKFRYTYLSQILRRVKATD